MSWLSSRSKAVHRPIKHHPTLLYRNGEMLTDHLKAQRITEEEVRATIRGERHAAMEDVEGVILESDGRFSVIERHKDTQSALAIEIEGVGARDGHSTHS